MPAPVSAQHAAREEEPGEAQAPPEDPLSERVELLFERRRPVARAVDERRQVPELGAWARRDDHRAGLCRARRSCRRRASSRGRRAARRRRQRRARPSRPARSRPSASSLPRRARSSEEGARRPGPRRPPRARGCRPRPGRDAETICTASPRRTRACGVCIFSSAASAASARRSWTKPEDRVERDDEQDRRGVAEAHEQRLSDPAGPVDQRDDGRRQQRQHDRVRELLEQPGESALGLGPRQFVLAVLRQARLGLRGAQTPAWDPSPGASAAIRPPRYGPVTARAAVR